MDLETLIRDTVRQVLREELRGLPASTPAAEPTAPADGYLSIAEAATLARVSKNTIRAWVKDGKLPRRMAGRELRVRRDDLHRLLAAAPAESGLTPEQAVANILERHG